jgi:hypothetical protein
MPAVLQTSSGKTHTMQGKLGDENHLGVMPRALQLIFKHIESAPSNVEFTVRMSYVELYCEKVQDLLKQGSNDLKIYETTEDGVCVQDAHKSECQPPPVPKHARAIRPGGRLSEPPPLPPPWQRPSPTCRR